MKYLICNLKATQTYDEALLYQEYLSHLKAPLTLIVAPSVIYLPLFSHNNYLLGCQDIPLYAPLQLTGDICFKQLQTLNVKYLFVGHYERRKYYHETNNTILTKITNALANHFKVIYFIGETKEEQERHVTYQVLEKMLAHIFNNLPEDQYHNIIIAYEPTYLIGSNELHDISQITNTIHFIKTLIQDYYNTSLDVVFGGNVTPLTLTELLNIPDLDGFVIGSSAENPENISLIIEKMTAAPK